MTDDEIHPVLVAKAAHSRRMRQLSDQIESSFGLIFTCESAMELRDMMVQPYDLLLKNVFKLVLKSHDIWSPYQ